jgi:membrane protein implicated in regulation of membrane protease activity
MIAIAGFVAFILLDSPLGVALLVAGVLIEIGELVFWVRFLRRYRVRTGREGLIGMRGEVLEEFSPEGRGRVRVRGEIWRAELAPGGHRPAPGEEIRVRGVEGLRLRVEPGAQSRQDPR